MTPRPTRKANRRTAGGTDARWEAMRPVLAGETPLFIHAIDLQQIREALDFTQRSEASSSPWSVARMPGVSPTC